MRSLILAAISIVQFDLAAINLAKAESSIWFSQNPNGGWAVGWNNNNPSTFDAESKAEANCRSNGGTNCSPVGGTFNNTCAAIAVQSGGNGWAVRTNADVNAARRNALSGCNKMGIRCELKGSFCDTVREVIRNVVCTQPVFKEERRLHGEMDGTDATTKRVAAAINYLHEKYCRQVEGQMTPEDQENLDENCWQYSGTYLGEKVYWGTCLE